MQTNRTAISSAFASVQNTKADAACRKANRGAISRTLPSNGAGESRLPRCGHAVQALACQNQPSKRDVTANHDFKAALRCTNQRTCATAYVEAGVPGPQLVCEAFYPGLVGEHVPNEPFSQINARGWQ